jgi:hypothetical protein
MEALSLQVQRQMNEELHWSQGASRSNDRRDQCTPNIRSAVTSSANEDTGGNVRIGSWCTRAAATMAMGYEHLRNFYATFSGAVAPPHRSNNECKQ